MKTHYRAMQVTGSGVLELAELPVVSPARGEVLIAVEACGVCGADANDIETADPKRRRVPGHEVVGCIIALGVDTPARWSVGQRVGIGRLGGPCMNCDQCRRGNFQLCQQQGVIGVTRDGGYAEMMLAPATGLVAIPNDLNSEDAAPILCAGLSTFNALRKSNADPGDTVAILGIGGLGHMAIQYARRLGFRVVAIGRGAGTREHALELGAHRYLGENDDVIAELRAMGGTAVLLSTIGSAETVAALLPSLSPSGRLILLGVGKDPLSLNMGALVGGERGVIGSLTGTPAESERALDFSILADIRPRIETLPLEAANEAYRRLKSGDITYRLVLTMNGDKHAHQ